MPSSLLQRLLTLNIGKKDNRNNNHNIYTKPPLSPHRSSSRIRKDSPSSPPTPTTTVSNESDTSYIYMNHLPNPTRSANAPPPPSASSSSTHRSQSQHHRNGTEGLAKADKEMEERANRAKELLSMRYRSLRHDQVSIVCVNECVYVRFVGTYNRLIWIKKSLTLFHLTQMM